MKRTEEQEKKKNAIIIAPHHNELHELHEHIRTKNTQFMMPRVVKAYDLKKKKVFSPFLHSKEIKISFEQIFLYRCRIFRYVFVNKNIQLI